MEEVCRSMWQRDKKKFMAMAKATTINCSFRNLSSRPFSKRERETLQLIAEGRAHRA